MHANLKPFSESGTSPPRRVTLIRVHLFPGRTVGIGVGRDAEGNEVTFAADWRPTLVLADALAAGETVEVLLEDWQVLARRRS